MIFRMVLDAQLVETNPLAETNREVQSAAAREADLPAGANVIDACRRGEADAFAALF